MNTKMRSNAFAAYGALSAYGLGSQHTAFLEQVASISTSVALIGASWELYLVRRPYCSFFALRFFFFAKICFKILVWCSPEVS
jgi:hypothetical protein